jgi:hypothetical protein
MGIGCLQEVRNVVGERLLCHYPGMAGKAQLARAKI